MKKEEECGEVSAFPEQFPERDQRHRGKRTIMCLLRFCSAAESGLRLKIRIREMLLTEKTENGRPQIGIGHAKAL